MNAKAIRRTLLKIGPPVLAAMSVVGVAITGYLSAKAGAKSAAILKEAEERKGESLTSAEKIKTAGKNYIPAVIAGTVTAASIVGGYKIGRRINASLSAGYLAIQEKYKQYREEVKSEYGEEAHAKILDRLTERDVARANPDDDVLSNTFCGKDCGLDFKSDDAELTFLDAWSGKYFVSTINKVLAAEFCLNRQLAFFDAFDINGDVTMDAWYEFLGIDTPDEAKNMCWLVGKNSGEMRWIDFNHYKLETDDGFEAYVIEFAREPVVNPYL